MNKIIVLSKQGTDTIHAIIPTKYHKYISTTILKNVNIWAKVNKSPWGRLHDMNPHDAYSTTTHIRKVTPAVISHGQRE